MVKRLLCILVVLCMSLQLFAYDFSAVNSDGVTIYYKVTSQTFSTVAVVAGLNTHYSGNVNIPANVTHNGNSYQVTGIGKYAFQQCTGLTSVTIPNSVTVIDTMAFRSCRALTSITLPSSLTKLGKEALYECSGLSVIHIPASVTTIDELALGFCHNITAITVASGNTVYDSRNNCNAIVETSTNKLIAGCQSSTIPNTVTSIGNYAFYRCDNLQSIAIPNSVTSIGVEAFAYCLQMASLTLSNSLTTIEEEAFAFCSHLTNINIPASVRNLGARPFRHCSGLTTLAVASGNTVYDSRNNSNAIIKKSNNSLVVGCSTSTIPNTVTSIGDDAFWDCALPNITIPSSVTRLGDGAFGYCQSLTSITLLSTTPPQLGADVFYHTNTSIPVYIPCGSTSAYQSSSSAWQQFTNYIESFPYTIALTSSNATMGEASVTSQPTCSNPTATIQAVANPGFQFASWSDGNTQNPRNITVSSNVNLTANFTFENSGIRINNVEITGDNETNFTAPGLTGTVTYDGNTHVLTLDNVSAESLSFISSPDVTVNFSGNNQFSQFVYNASEQKVTLHGQTATAQFSAAMIGAEDAGSDIELANGIFRINEDMYQDYGLYGYGEENLTFTNAEAYVGGSYCAIDSWHSITLNSCEIVAPVGAVVEDGCVRLNGDEIANDIVHIAPIEQAIDIVRTTEFAIVPNPAKDETLLMLEPYTGTATMQIVDANGRILTTVMLPAQQENYRLDVSTLEAGTYFINVTANGTRQTATLVKK